MQDWLCFSSTLPSAATASQGRYSMAAVALVKEKGSNIMDADLDGIRNILPLRHVSADPRGDRVRGRPDVVQLGRLATFSGPGRRTHMLPQPGHERLGRLQTGPDALVALSRVQPGLERVGGGRPAASSADGAGAGGPSGSPAGARLSSGSAGARPPPGRDAAALERGRPARVVDRGAEPLELVGSGVPQAGGDEQAVERKVEVEPARRRRSRSRRRGAPSAAARAGSGGCCRGGRSAA